MDSENRRASISILFVALFFFTLFILSCKQSGKQVDVDTIIAANCGKLSSLNVESTRIFNSGNAVNCIVPLHKGSGQEQSCLIGTAGGVYRIFNSGNRWKKAKIGLDQLDIKCLAYSPKGKGHLIAGTTEGIFTKNGFSDGHWTASEIQLSIPYIASTAIAPISPNEMLISVYGEGKGYIYKSLDRGETWSRSDSGIGSVEAVLSLACCQLYGQLIWFAGTEVGLYLSVDRGKNWVLSSGGIPIDAVVLCIHVSRFSQVVYVGTAENGLYISENYGRTFRQVDSLPSSPSLDEVWSIGTCPVKDRRSHGSVNRTTNNGKKCEAIFVATTKTIQKSMDSGETWTDIGAEIVSKPFSVNSIAYVSANVDPKKSSTGKENGGLLAGFEDGSVWLYSENKWAMVIDLLGSISVHAVDIDSSGQTAYIACATASTFQGVWKSANAGQTWVRCNSLHPHKNPFIGAIEVDPSGRVFAGSFPSSSSFEKGLWRSTDCGMNWAKVFDKANVSFIKYLAGDYYLGADESMFNETLVNRGLFTSTDGLAWSRIFGPTPFSGGGMVAMCVDVMPPHVYVGAFYNPEFDGVWKSMPGIGFINITKKSFGYVLPTGIACDLSSHNRLYLSSLSSGLLHTVDGGASWQQVPCPIPNGRAIDVKVHPLNPATVLAIGKKGVFISLDGGSTWTGLGPKECTVMCCDVYWGSTQNFAFIGTLNNGLWKLKW